MDGKAVQTITMPHTLPMILQWDESFDIGSDTLTGVNDADYQPPFPLTAKLNKLTIKVDRPKLTEEDIKKLENASNRARRQAAASHAVRSSVALHGGANSKLVSVVKRAGRFARSGAAEQQGERVVHGPNLPLDRRATLQDPERSNP